MIAQKEIDNWFMYHAPTAEQLVAYNDIRCAAKIYAETVNKHVPDSADKTAAMRKIRESVAAANLAVACNWPLPENEARPGLDVGLAGNVAEIPSGGVV